MRVEIYKSNEIPQHIFGVVSDLLHDAFAERREQGINFQCGLFSPQDVENEFNGNNGYLFLAIQESKPVGTITFLEHRKGHLRYAATTNLAVSSIYKGKGVATALWKEVFNMANQNSYDFLSSCTAVNANSSVHMHLKQGFVIYEKSFGRDYNSYSFIYPLKKMRFMRCKLLSKTVYMLLTVKNRIKK